MKRLVGSTRSKRITKTTSNTRRETPRSSAANSDVPSAEKTVNAVEDTWSLDRTVLRRAAEARARDKRNGVHPMLQQTEEDRFQAIAASLNHSSAEVRKEAVRTLFGLNPDRAASLFNIALQHGSPRERRAIGVALSSSGLIDQALEHLIGENHQDCYGAFSLLFLLAKSGEVQPLIEIIEQHPSMHVRLAVVRLLSASGAPEVVSTFRHLAVRQSLPHELRTAMLDAVAQVTHITSSAA